MTPGPVTGKVAWRVDGEPAIDGVAWSDGSLAVFQQHAVLRLAPEGTPTWRLELASARLAGPGVIAADGDLWLLLVEAAPASPPRLSLASLSPSGQMRFRAPLPEPVGAVPNDITGDPYLAGTSWPWGGVLLDGLGDGAGRHRLVARTWRAVADLSAAGSGTCTWSWRPASPAVGDAYPDGPCDSSGCTSPLHRGRLLGWYAALPDGVFWNDSGRTFKWKSGGEPEAIYDPDQSCGRDPPADLPLVAGQDGSLFVVVMGDSAYGYCGEGVTVCAASGGCSSLLVACVWSEQTGAGPDSLGLTLLAGGDALVRCGGTFRRLRPASSAFGAQTVWESAPTLPSSSGDDEYPCWPESSPVVADSAEAGFFHCRERMGRLQPDGGLAWYIDPAVGRVHALIPGRPGELYVLGDKGVAMIR
jgi:hypothetical protein